MFTLITQLLFPLIGLGRGGATAPAGGAAPGDDFTLHMDESLRPEAEGEDEAALAVPPPFPPPEPGNPPDAVIQPGTAPGLPEATPHAATSLPPAWFTNRLNPDPPGGGVAAARDLRPPGLPLLPLTRPAPMPPLLPTVENLTEEPPPPALPATGQPAATPAIWPATQQPVAGLPPAVEMPLAVMAMTSATPGMPAPQVAAAAPQPQDTPHGGGALPAVPAHRPSQLVAGMLPFLTILPGPAAADLGAIPVPPPRATTPLTTPPGPTKTAVSIAVAVPMDAARTSGHIKQAATATNVPTGAVRANSLLQQATTATDDLMGITHANGDAGRDDPARRGPTDAARRSGQGADALVNVTGPMTAARANGYRPDGTVERPDRMTSAGGNGDGPDGAAEPPDRMPVARVSVHARMSLPAAPAPVPPASPLQPLVPPGGDDAPSAVPPSPARPVLLSGMPAAAMADVIRRSASTAAPPAAPRPAATQAVQPIYGPLSAPAVALPGGGDNAGSGRPVVASPAAPSPPVTLRADRAQHPVAETRGDQTSARYQAVGSAVLRTATPPHPNSEILRAGRHIPMPDTRTLRITGLTPDPAPAAVSQPRGVSLSAPAAAPFLRQPRPIMTQPAVHPTKPFPATPDLRAETADRRVVAPSAAQPAPQTAADQQRLAGGDPAPRPILPVIAAPVPIGSPLRLMLSEADMPPRPADPLRQHQMVSAASGSRSTPLSGEQQLAASRPPSQRVDVTSGQQALPRAGQMVASAPPPLSPAGPARHELPDSSSLPEAARLPLRPAMPVATVAPPPGQGLFHPPGTTDHAPARAETPVILPLVMHNPAPPPLSARVAGPLADAVPPAVPAPTAARETARGDNARVSVDRMAAKAPPSPQRPAALIAEVPVAQSALPRLALPKDGPPVPPARPLLPLATPPQMAADPAPPGLPFAAPTARRPAPLAAIIPTPGPDGPAPDARAQAMRMRSGAMPAPATAAPDARAAVPAVNGAGSPADRSNAPMPSLRHSPGAVSAPAPALQRPGIPARSWLPAPAMPQPTPAWSEAAVVSDPQPVHPQRQAGPLAESVPPPAIPPARDAAAALAATVRLQTGAAGQTPIPAEHPSPLALRGPESWPVTAAEPAGRAGQQAQMPSPAESDTANRHPVLHSDTKQLSPQDRPGGIIRHSPALVAVSAMPLPPGPVDAGQSAASAALPHRRDAGATGLERRSGAGPGSAAQPPEIIRPAKPSLPAQPASLAAEGPQTMLPPQRVAADRAFAFPAALPDSDSSAAKRPELTTVRVSNTGRSPSSEPSLSRFLPDRPVRDAPAPAEAHHSALTKAAPDQPAFTEPASTQSAPGLPPVSAEPDRPLALPAPRIALPPSLPVMLAEVALARPDAAVELALAPEELGRLRMNVLPEGEGVRVTLLAERPETLELLRRHAGDLGQEFRQAGFAFTAFSFGGWQGKAPPAPTAITAAEPPAVPPSPDLPPDRLLPGPAGGLDLRL